ncbi:hypothetical protein PHET_03860 [Paragonimus heterotremus]|uniref:Uncharacterized protein n=1 Tax=Paragonimus heterotremus TaxID=100268 RepID=A0A8J4TE27_9TREM|nr:hypothetical protein PHET_03860 [Paragonimus heterotremus]
MVLAKFNVTWQDGFQRENEVISDMSSNAKSILQHLLSVTNGDLSQTAKLLDNILSETQLRIKKLTEDEYLSDVEFYERLSKLRAEHKNTLDVIERLYLTSAMGTLHVSQPTEVVIKSNNIQNEPENYHSFKSPMNDSKHLASVGDIRETSDKSTLLKSLKQTLDSTRTDLHQNKDSLNLPRAIISTTKVREAYSSETEHSPIRDRITSPSGWRHRLTIPVPFEMCKREEAKKRAGHMTRSLSGLLHERWEKEVQLQEECRIANRFRARPIPAHVYLPLFDRIMEQQAMRRQAVRQHSRDAMEANERPFSFSERDRERRSRTRDRMFNPHHNHHHPWGRSRGRTFTRKPPPTKEIVDVATDTQGLPGTVTEDRTERSQEDELLRGVKRKIRAERLLNSSAVPIGMEERRRRSEMRRAERMERNRRQGLDPDSSGQDAETGRFKARPAPDFSQVHRQSDRNMRRIWRPPPDPTRPKPFNFHSGRRPTSGANRAQSNLDDGLQRARSAPGRDQPFHPRRGAQRRPFEMGHPAKSRVSMLRENYIRRSLEQAKLDAEKAKAYEKFSNIKQKEVAQWMRQSFGDKEVTPEKAVQSAVEKRKQELLNQNQARQSDYRKEVEAIKQRVSNRPLLVTQQAQSIARKRMEEKIDNSLKQSGLDPRKPLSVKTSERLIRTKPDSPTAKRWNSQDEVEVYDPSNHFGDLDDSRGVFGGDY